MSKGRTIEHIEKGKYRVKLLPDNTGIDSRIAKIDARITQYTTERTAAKTDYDAKTAIVNQKKAALNRAIRRLSEWQICVADKVSEMCSIRRAYLATKQAEEEIELPHGLCGTEKSLLSGESVDIGNFATNYLGGDPPDLSGAMAQAGTNQENVIDTCLDPPSEPECTALKNIYCSQAAWWGQVANALGSSTRCIEEAQKGIEKPVKELAEAQRDEAEAESKWNRLKLLITALETEKSSLQRKKREETEVALWCAAANTEIEDDTEVGIIDLVDDKKKQVIKPKCAAEVAWTKSDGVELSPFAISGAATFARIANSPGGEYWRPSYRTAVITAIDYDADTCSITLDDAIDPLQALAIDETREIALVPIEYLTCHAEAFEVNDKVVVKFEKRDRKTPKVIGFVEEPRGCEYVESGRYNLSTGAGAPAYLDISSDITGCNGRCPTTTPMTAGPSRTLKGSSPEVDARKACQAEHPACGFTGKLHLMMQAMYGSPRTDLVTNGEEVYGMYVAGIGIANRFSYSSILYTDDDGEYWMLALAGCEIAEIQSWKPGPCGSVHEKPTTIEEEVYLLSSLLPNGAQIRLTVTGGHGGTTKGVPAYYGWHSTRKGDVGHLVLLNTSEAAYDAIVSRLYKYELTDTGAVWDKVTPWVEYVAARFSVSITLVTEYADWRPHDYHRSWIPDGVPRLNQTWAQRRLFDFNLAGASDVIVDAPLYVYYTADDELKPVTYSFSIPAVSPAFGCSGDFVYPYEETAYTCGLNSYTDLPLGRGLGTAMMGGFAVDGLPPAPIARGRAACFSPPEPSCRTSWQVRSHFVWQSLIIPWRNCEAVEIMHLETDQYLDYFGGVQDIEWNRQIYSCSRHGIELIQAIEGAEHLGDDPTSFDLLDPDAPAFSDGMYLYFADWNDNSTGIADRVQDVQSYQYGHRNSWFSGNGDVYRHDGYPDYLRNLDSSFVGKS